MSPRSRPRAVTTWLGAVALAAAGAAFSAAAPARRPSRPRRRRPGFNSYVQDLCQGSATWASDAEASSPRSRRAAPTRGPRLPVLHGVAHLQQRVRTAHLRDGLRDALDLPTRRRDRRGARTAPEGVPPAAARRDHPEREGRLARRHPPLERRGLVQELHLAVLTPYLKLAQQEKVEYFAISTELDSLSKKSNWSSIISTAKRYYKGSLTFTVTWTFGATGKVTHAGTTPGMDTYQAINLPTTATPANLLSAWNTAVSGYNKVPFALSSATIDEVAILAQDGAYHTPYAWSLPPATNPFDQSIQANWYSMACSFFRTHDMRGIYFWGVWYADGANAVLTTPDPSLAQEIQPASAAVIKHCYTGK